MLAQLPSIDKLFEALPQMSPTQAAFAFAFLLLIVGYFVVRHTLAPGSQTLAARQANTKDIAIVLQNQIVDLNARNEKLETENHALEESLHKSEKERTRLETIYNTNPYALRARADELEGAHEVAAVTGMARILVIDDNGDARALLQTHLMRLAYNVTVTSKAARGVKMCIDAMAKNEPFDLILLDEAMPEMSGQGFVKAIRALGDTTRVIFVTGHAQQENGALRLDGKTAAELDVYAIWAKPLDFRTLPAQLEQSLL